MKILVSGFERFGGFPENTSEEMLKLLTESSELKTVLLPVTFREAFLKLKVAIEEYQPDAVLCLGLAAKRPRISIEKIAVNVIDCDLPDNDGTVYRDTTIATSGPAAYVATLPVHEMLAASTAYPTELSYHAGTYVCNYVMYNVLHFLRDSEVKGGFVHLPELEDKRDQIFASLEAMLEAIRHSFTPAS